MQLFQQRVVDEKTELDEKREKLGAFIKGDFYQTLPNAERNRLTQQAIAMAHYSTILGERIAAFDIYLNFQSRRHHEPTSNMEDHS